MRLFENEGGLKGDTQDNVLAQETQAILHCDRESGHLE